MSDNSSLARHSLPSKVPTWLAEYTAITLAYVKVQLAQIEAQQRAFLSTSRPPYSLLQVMGSVKEEPKRSHKPKHTSFFVGIFEESKQD